MPSAHALGAILATLFERPRLRRRTLDDRPLPELCDALMAEKVETSSLELAAALFARYAELPHAEKRAFFAFINDHLDVDAAEVARAAEAYGRDRTPEAFAALMRAAEPRRQELFRRLNQPPGATAELVKMRAELLSMLAEAPELARTDHDLRHLLRSWFNRGFLVLRRITWDSPAAILEKIIAYEAVHEIASWDDLRARLQPEDRRLFAFFHPAMPGEPLIFVEVALSRGVPGSIAEVLAPGREPIDPADADTAVFYSISNCQKGLAGVSFGNSLIKQVVRDLAAELPGLQSFVTLSPIPGLAAWLTEAGLADAAGDPLRLKRLAAHYLLAEKTPDGAPRDPVARFHLGNGALVHAIHLDADPSPKGRAQSFGVMVNYLYDLDRIQDNLRDYEATGRVAAAPQVRSLARQAQAETAA
ncbi:MAG: decarboxylase [Alphaproteobacteria bacterium]|nr:MAG: decarboxylase [Alphaproteobacteria bacterium]